MQTRTNGPDVLEPIDPPGRRGYRWAVVGMLWFLCFFNYADRQAIFSIFPVLKANYHFSKTDLGLIGAAFMWVYAFAAPFAGHVGDRYPRKWVILGGLYVWSLVTGLTALCTRVSHFVLVRGAEGMGETFYMPASMALISDYHGPSTRSTAIGWHQSSIYAGTVAGSALAGWMALKFGWWTPFWVLALAGMALGVIVQLFLREPRRNHAERLERTEAPAPPAQVSVGTFLAEFVRTPTAILLIVAFFGANMVGFVFLTWMPTFLTEKWGLNLAQAGFGGTVFIQIFSMVGVVLGGIIADWWRRVRTEGRILVQAIGALAGVPFVFLCGYTRSPALLVVAMSLFGLSKGFYDSNLTPAFYDVITPSRRSTATGLMNFVGFVGAGLGSVAVGAAVDKLKITMSMAIASTAVVYFLVACVLFLTAALFARRDIAAARLRSSMQGSYCA
ncbi:MAG TPA: MFS transporter [Chthonomonadaceae bacterium]|nr:MFS transporter [Chthonomonadaceae bacterium]